MEAATSLQSPITKNELRSYEKFIKKCEDNERVERCRNKNILRNGTVISEGKFWRCFVIAILTTQTKSGKGSALEEFIKTKPNILNYKYCIKIEGKESIEREVTKGVTRFRERACLYISEAIGKFKQGFWRDVKTQLKIIETDTTLKKERETSDFIRKNFKGVGRKQSRNIIQMMGLSKYVLPIDSRVVKKVEELSGITLNKKISGKDYLQLEDRLQEICESIGIYPCIFDACAFNTQETTIYAD